MEQRRFHGGAQGHRDLPLALRLGINSTPEDLQDQLNQEMNTVMAKVMNAGPGGLWGSLDSNSCGDCDVHYKLDVRIKAK